MDAKFYNKICIAYQNLSERFTNYSKNFIDGNVVYDKDLFLFQAERGEFLKQFEGIPFGTFFKENFIDEQNAPLYYDRLTVEYGDKVVKIHTEFSMVLFYYIANELKKGIQALIDILNSPEFNEYFKDYIKSDKYTVRYSLSAHDRIYLHLEREIVNFGLIYHLFHRTNTHIMRVEDSLMVISKERISNILKWNDKMYDFTKFKIQ